MRSNRYGVVLGLLTLVVVTVLDLGFSDVLRLTTYAGAAFVTAFLASPRHTAIVAGLSATAGFLTGLLVEDCGVVECGVALMGSCLLGASAVMASWLRDRRRRNLQTMTTIAATAQRAVLRDIPPTVEGIDVAVSYVSAAREALIGGDLYEAMPTRFGLRALIGDVRGKGLEAVQLASTVLGAFRGACLHEASLVKMSRDLDSLVQALGDDEDFVTALLIEVHEDTITIASCGHHAPLCVSPDGELLFLQPTSSGAPLGLLAEPTTTVFPWPSGSRLLLYTDGLVEARNDEGMFFPLGIHSDLLSRESLQGCLEGLVNELEKFTGEGINDDLGLMLLRRP